MTWRADQRVPGSWRGAPGSGGGDAMYQADGSGRSNGGWTPTVSSLLVLIGLEIAAYCALRYVFRTAHGG